MIPLSLIHLEDVPILDQLRLEEALLRAHDGNWCLINTGAPPAIVTGISAKPEKLLDLSRIQQDRTPVLKRFSGGGTVYIDEETLFVTFIMNHEAVPISPYPRSIMEWSATVYRPLFTHPDFALEENDYVFGEHKFGGNAQYLTRNRWLHHTSFLWDYDPQKMEYLLLPEKQPAYRQNRPHTDFLCRLKEYYPTKKELIQELKKILYKQFDILETSTSSLPDFLPHRQSTKQLF